MQAEHLLLVLEAPLVAFGIEAVDSRRPVGDFPGASLLTGLLANALGWRREERARHDRLQTRLRFGARLDRAKARLTDYQTAELFADDEGWTTFGVAEGRNKKSSSYERSRGSARRRLTHIRERGFAPDASVAVAFRLDPAGEAPDLDALAAALERPARPLFIGRKPCLPSRPVFAGRVAAAGLAAALCTIPPAEDADPAPRVLLPPGEPEAGRETILVADLRNWRSGVHGGQRTMHVGRTGEVPP